MIEILRQYWQSYLWTDGLQMTGVAMTAWLLVLSIGIGCACCAFVTCASIRKYLVAWSVWLFTYVFVAHHCTSNY